MGELLTAQFWLGLGAIIWVNIILSGDNAVGIPLAARSLPAHQQTNAALWGAGAARGPRSGWPSIARAVPMPCCSERTVCGRLCAVVGREAEVSLAGLIGAAVVVVVGKRLGGRKPPGPEEA